MQRSQNRREQRRRQELLLRAHVPPGTPRILEKEAYFGRYTVNHRGKWECEECGFAFHTDVLLKRHLNQRHKMITAAKRINRGSKTHECAYCGKRVEGEPSLLRHLFQSRCEQFTRRRETATGREIWNELKIHNRNTFERQP